jgi:hypothetical protein
MTKVTFPWVTSMFIICAACGAPPSDTPEESAPSAETVVHVAEAATAAPMTTVRAPKAPPTASAQIAPPGHCLCGGHWPGACEVCPPDGP